MHSYFCVFREADREYLSLMDNSMQRAGEHREQGSMISLAVDCFHVLDEQCDKNETVVKDGQSKMLYMNMREQSLARSQHFSVSGSQLIGGK